MTTERDEKGTSSGNERKGEKYEAKEMKEAVGFVVAKNRGGRGGGGG